MNFAYLIDPEQRVVVPLRPQGSFSKALGVSALHYVTLWASADGEHSIGLYVDDRGLLGDAEQQRFFRLPRFYRGVFAGKAVLQGDDDAPPLWQDILDSAECVAAEVNFISPAEALSILSFY